MCFILQTALLNTAHASILEDAWNSNGDGAGIATHDGSRLILMKPFMKWGDLERVLRRIMGQPAIVHLRMATHGGVSGTNVHPFWTLRGKQGLLAHNGIMPSPWGNNRGISDSLRFAESLRQFGMDEVRAGALPLEKSIGNGNKVVIMDKDGAVFFLNRDAGHDYDATTWCSMDPQYLFIRNTGYTYNHGGKTVYRYPQYHNQGTYTQPRLMNWSDKNDEQEYSKWLQDQYEKEHSPRYME